MEIAYRKKDHIVYREEGTGAFLFDPEDGNLKYLNHSAKEIYLCLSESRNSKQISRTLFSLYPDTSRDQLEKDVTGFLKQLADHHFIMSAASDDTHGHG